MVKNIRQVRTREDVKQLGTILSVWAHPDDETYCCGALMAAAIRNGQRVICVTATRGEKGVQDAKRWPTEKLGEIREAELDAALHELGVTEHHWLGYQDGMCEGVSQEEAAQQITAFIEQGNVDTVLTFGPEGLTGHPDHRTVSRWVDAGVHASSRKPRIFHLVQSRDSYENYLKQADQEINIFFQISQPPLADANECAIWLGPEPKSIEQKYRALKMMPSQTTNMLKAIPPAHFVGAYGTETFVEVIPDRK